MGIFGDDNGEVKDSSRISSSPEDGTPYVAEEGVWGETRFDMVDMKRLGKKQEFKVRSIYWRARKIC